LVWIAAGCTTAVAVARMSYQVRVNANGTTRSATAMRSLLVVAVDSRPRFRDDKLRGNDAHGTEWVSAARMLSRSNGLGM
jgi:hypothetical protein